MKIEEYPKFRAFWSDVVSMFNQEASETRIKLTFNSLADRSLKDVINATYAVLKTSRFVPTVADIEDAIKAKQGQDKAGLEARANDFYNKLNKDFTMAKDIITPDRRAVLAFTQCFGDLFEFGSHDLSADPFDRKAFVNAYVNAHEEWLDRVPARIRGIYADSERVPVRFIGDYKECTRLAELEFADKRQVPVLPLKQEAKLLQAPNRPAETKYVTKEEHEQYLQELEHELNKMMLHRKEG